MLTKPEIEKKIADLTKQRDDLIVQANGLVRELNGKIAAFTETIADTPLSLVPNEKEETA